MSQISKPSNAPASAGEKQEITAFRNYLTNPNTIKAIRDVLPVSKKGDVERILRIAIMEFANNAALHACSMSSVATALMSACRLGLEVGSLTGHAYLIPYNGRCTLQIGYKGLVELAYRMGTVNSIRARTVHEGDEIEIIGGTEDSLKHRIALDNRGKVKGYYVIADLKEGRPLFLYMSVEEIAAHRAQFCKGGGNFWDKFPEQMAYKTIFIKLFKWLPNKLFSEALNENESNEYGVIIDNNEQPHGQNRSTEVAESIEEVEMSEIVDEYGEVL